MISSWARLWSSMSVLVPNHRDIVPDASVAGTARERCQR